MSYLSHQFLSHRQPARVVYPAPQIPDVLVVDDDRFIAQFICDALEEEGYGVRIAHDGANGLLAIRQCRPGVVLLDVAMPVMFGDELLRYLRRNGYDDLPVVIMTAGLHPESYLADGANAILAKPFEVNALLDEVFRYLPLASN